VEYLNSRGYVTRSNKPFSKTSLYGILRNRKYIGVLMYNMYAEKDMAGKRNPQLKPQEVWVIVDGGIPAIISQELFDKVQAMLIRNHQTGGRHKAREIYLLSGLLFCGECGAGVYGNSRHSGRDPERNGLKYTSYRCSNAKCINKEIRREAIERAVYSVERDVGI
jgi:site-specific DNA recombinase